jgi:hypothetical protein
LEIGVDGFEAVEDNGGVIRRDEQVTLLHELVDLEEDVDRELMVELMGQVVEELHYQKNMA